MSWGQDPGARGDRDPDTGQDGAAEPGSGDDRNDRDDRTADVSWGTDRTADASWDAGGTADATWRDDPPGGTGWGADAGWQPPPSEPTSRSRDAELRRNPQLGRDPQWGRDPARDTLRPMNLGDVLDGMFRLAGRHWQAFAIALSTVVVPLALLSGIALFETASSGSFLDAFQDSVGATDPPDPADLTRIAASSVLSSIAALVATPFIYGIAVQVAAHGYRQGEVDPMAAVRAAGGRYLSLAGALLLTGVALFAVVLAGPLIVGLVLAVGGIDGPVAGIAIGVAIIGSFVLAIVATTRLSLAVPAIMVERLRAYAALQRSNALVQGGTGRVLGILIVVGIIVSIISFVVSLPFQLALFSGGAAGVALATAGSIVSNLLTYSLMAAAIVLLYFDRRVRTEGYDLSELARELGQESQPPW